MQVIANTPSITTILFTAVEDQNTITSAQINEFAKTLEITLASKTLRALILAGEGENFCTGRIAAPNLTTAVAIRDDLALILNVNTQLRQSPVPIIAAVEGRAFGFGCGLATQADITVAATDATFALPEMSHKLPPLVVLSYFGKLIPVKKAFELALTSRIFPVQEAETLNIVSEITPPGQAHARALAIAQTITELDQESVRLLRRFAREVAGLADDQDARRGIDAMAIAMANRPN